MVGDNLQEMILNSAMQFRDAINRHLQLNWWFFLDFAESNSKEIMKAFDYFFHINGRFPVDEELKTLYKAKLPNFIHSNKAISPIYLYEKFRDSKFHVLLCTHCFCALNIHFGNNPELSWNEMNDFFHKTSMQPTAKSNSDVLVNFDKIPDSLTNINYLLQQKTYGFKMDEQQEKHVTSDIYINEDYFKEKTDDLNILEQEVANFIMENNYTEYPKWHQRDLNPQTLSSYKRDTQPFSQTG